MVDVISRRLNDGAQLIVFLDAPDAPSLASPAFSPPFALVRAIESPEGQSLMDGPRKLFADADPGDWSGLRFYRHYFTQMARGHSNELFLIHADGSAALTVSPAGKGAVAFVNLPLTPDGGDLIGSPMFPAALHELLRSMRLGAKENSDTPGQPWEIEAPTISDAPVVVVDPNQQPVESKVISTGRTTLLSLHPARLPGIYSVTQGGKVITAAAVNVDPRESDTRALAPESLVIAGNPNASIMRDDNASGADAKNRPLWPQLAATALSLFALEMLVLTFWRSPRLGWQAAVGEAAK